MIASHQTAVPHDLQASMIRETEGRTKLSDRITQLIHQTSVPVTIMTCKRL